MKLKNKKMKSLKLIKRKRLKKRIRRRNFSKKRNIRNNNWPTPREKEVVPVLSLSRTEDGRVEFKDKKARYKVIGEKTIIRKVRKSILSAGDGFLPKSKKFKIKKDNGKLK